jgi:hypothetical protein
MPVSDTENGQHLLGAVQVLVVRAPAGEHLLDRQRHVALVGELEGVGQQVLQDLLQALGVRDHRSRQVRGRCGR